MGVSRDSKQLVAKLHQAEKVMGDSGTRAGLLPVAKRVESVMIRSAASAGLHKGSRIAGRPWRGTYIRPEGAKNLAVGYANPAHLVNNRTRAHVIGARKLGTRGAIRKRTEGAALVSFLSGSTVAASFRPRGVAKGAKALHWGNNFAAYVRSPGTKGKQFYQRAKPQAREEGADEYGKTVSRGLARVFA